MSCEHEFYCEIYLTDGVTLWKREPCKTASEAMEQAMYWTHRGYKAEAQLMVVQYKRRKTHFYFYPLK